MQNHIYPEMIESCRSEGIPDNKTIISVARSYIGTPWHHAGRLRGIGVDCIGLIVCVCIDLGIPVSDDTIYSEGDEFAKLKTNVERHTTRVPSIDRACGGDILVFRGRLMHNHVGLLTYDGTFIHAYRSIGRVAETRLEETWTKRIVGVYRYKWQR